jgi:20S proteasome alpha/beta subunit
MCIAMQGDLSDCEYIYSHISQESKLHELVFQKAINIHTFAHICRKLFAQNLRKQNKNLKVNMLIGGWDDSSDESVLYWLDNLANLQEITFGAFGFQNMYILSFIDKYIRELKKNIENDKSSDNINISNNMNGLSNVTQEESILLIKECWNYIYNRLSINNINKSICIRIIDKNKSVEENLSE